VIRLIYRALLWLHPAEFEERFSDEMLWIFDLQQPGELGISLLIDCLVSLCRQWLNYPPVRTFTMGLSVSLMLALCSVVFALNSTRKH
jgi:hypothetical protein